jgi:hypothetical protein
MQVSWSSQAVVRLVPGSVEQRGTDLERFMRGADRFSRPVSSGEGAFLVSVQLAGEGAGEPGWVLLHMGAVLGGCCTWGQCMGAAALYCVLTVWLHVVVV